MSNVDGIYRITHCDPGNIQYGTSHSWGVADIDFGGMDIGGGLCSMWNGSEALNQTLKDLAAQTQGGSQTNIDAAEQIARIVIDPPDEPGGVQAAAHIIVVTGEWWNDLYNDGHEGQIFDWYLIVYDVYVTNYGSGYTHIPKAHLEPESWWAGNNVADPENDLPVVVTGEVQSILLQNSDTDFKENDKLIIRWTVRQHERVSANYGEPYTYARYNVPARFTSTQVIDIRVPAPEMWGELYGYPNYPDPDLVTPEWGTFDPAEDEIEGNPHALGAGRFPPVYTDWHKWRDWERYNWAFYDIPMWFSIQKIEWESPVRFRQTADHERLTLGTPVIVKEDWLDSCIHQGNKDTRTYPAIIPVSGLYRNPWW
jgi:hypothetical protein